MVVRLCKGLGVYSFHVLEGHLGRLFMGGQAFFIMNQGNILYEVLSVHLPVRV